jgi:protein-tyrosine phosphatase
MAEAVAPAPSLPSFGGKRPWRRATAWLVVLGTFFYASYGFSNWLASQHTHVPAIVFAWEHAVPFVAWTIIPYWTTNLLFALSFYLARDTSELDTHGKRLLTAQVVAVAFFIAVPLRTSFPKPQTGGIPGFFFEALGTFDMPFNQAPSLHVAITTVLISFYARILPPRLMVMFALWSLLVVTSVLTTFQHHFIDIPTGLLLGLICIWCWPWRADSRLSGWRTAAEAQHKALAGRYGAAAVVLAVLAVAFGGGFLWLLWPAVALFAVALAYAGFGPSLFAKGNDGQLDWATRLILAPYLVGAWLNSRLWTRREPRRVEISDGVHLGRFPSTKDCAGMAAVVDLTCEFSRPSGSRTWISIPMLDLVAPEAVTLRLAADAIERTRQQGPVLVCCALGYGRSVAALAVWLVRTKRVADLATALQMLAGKRPRLALNERQRSAIAEAIDAE